MNLSKHTSRIIQNLLTAVVCAAVLSGSARTAHAQTPLGAVWTYQGKLELSSSPVDDTADFEFSLWDADVNGNQIDSTQTVSNVEIVDGLFTVELDFGADAFNGDARWLEIWVRSPHDPSDLTSYELLSPRQPLTAAPYALFALDSGGGGTGDGHSLDAVDGTPTDAVFVDNDGNVGIGTTTPGVPLDVYGSLRVSRAEQLDQAHTTGVGFITELSIGQSFTAGSSGPLTRIDVRTLAASLSSGGTLSIYEGNGYGGTLLTTQPYTWPVGQNMWIANTLVNPVSVSAGQQYTFRFQSSDGSMRLAMDGEGGYPLGSLIDYPDYDLRFRTYVIPDSAPALAVTDLGNVGIGTTSPSRLLDVNGTAKIGGSLFFDSPSTFEVAHENNTGMRIDPVANSVHLEADNLLGLTLTAGGNVGIGTSDPLRRLHVEETGDGENNVIRLTRKAQSSSDSQSVTFWLDPTNEVFKLDVGGNGNAAARIHLGDSSSPDNDVTMLGNVGIGTATPTRGKVDIEGFENHTPGPFGYLNDTGGSGTNPGTGPTTYSLYASHRIAASEFNAHSDARIKNVLGRSDGDADLNTLMRIKVTDYTMADTVAHGDRPRKKVIGQQVSKVFPQAVTTSTNVVPDIYRLGDAESCWIRLDSPVEPPLRSGDQVRLITGDGAALHEVLDVKEDGFRVSASVSGSVFVYGRQVDDFHHVDYEAIAMLNVSATQALNEQLSEKDAEIKALNERLARLEALVERLSSE